MKRLSATDLLMGGGGEWGENEHPRDGNGQFTSNGSTDVEQKRADELTKSDTASGDISSLLGKEFIGVKGQAAIDKLLQEKKGHIKGAFHREDIGDIDLLWGNDSFGLKHIIKRREEQGIDVSEFIKDIAEVIEKGIFKRKNDKGRFEFWRAGKMAVISPELHGNKITYLLTAFKRNRDK